MKKNLRSKTIVIITILMILIFSPAYQSLTFNNETYYSTTGTFDAKDFTIVIHRIKAEDPIESLPGDQANWRLYMYVNGAEKTDEYYGDDIILGKTYTWEKIITDDTTYLNIEMRLLDTDDWPGQNDIADIGAKIGGGPDDTNNFPRGSIFKRTYDLTTKEWEPVDENNDFLTDETIDSYTWKKTSGDFDGSTDFDENDASIWFDVLIENLPPSQPKKPEGPVYCNQYETCSYSITSGDPDEDDQIKFGLDWDGDNNIDEETGFYQSWTPVTVNHTWINTGTNNFKVIAIDAHNAVSSWSESLKVVVVLSTNGPPDVPTITSAPTTGKINKKYEFKFYATDPDGDDVLFYIEWGDANEGWLGPYKSGEIVSMNHTWVAVGDFTIRIKSKDVYDHEKLIPWTELPITITKSKTTDRPFIRFLDNYPSLLRLFEQIIPSFANLVSSQIVR